MLFLRNFFNPSRLFPQLIKNGILSGGDCASTRNIGHQQRVSEIARRSLNRRGIIWQANRIADLGQILPDDQR